jgi:hypothetical protein
MTRAAVLVASVAVLCLTLGIDARAEPIRISGGSIVFENGHSFGLLSIVGNRGFSADAFVDPSETNVGPLVDCGFGCPPGITIPTGMQLVGSAVRGTVTLDGQTYEDVNGSVSGNFLELHLSGTIDIPPLRNTPASISAPFDADGFFEHVDLSDPSGTSFFIVPIQGSGRVTLNLAPESVNWRLNFPLRYEFATPTPEPATLTMVGAPLVAALIRARKRRDRRQLSTSTPTA